MMRGSQTVDWSRAYGLMQRKSNRRIIASTAYSAAFARLLDPLCDLLLVDCDVAALMHGLPDRSAADLDMMLLHGKSVSRGAKRSAVAIELPGSAWMQSPEQAFRSASRLLDETECCGVMLPLETVAIETTRFLVDRGIPVMSGIDISPPADAGLGRQFAEGEREWLRIQVLKDAAAVGQAGVFAIVATGRNDALALQLSKAVAVPVIGAESASLCDGDLLRDVECLALLNSVRRNADLNTRAATRPESIVSRSAGRAPHASDRSAFGAEAAGLRPRPRTAVADSQDAAKPAARVGSMVAPVPRAEAGSKELEGSERRPASPNRRPQPTGDAVGPPQAGRSASEADREDPGRPMSIGRRTTGMQAEETPPSDRTAVSLDRLSIGRSINRAEHGTRSTTTPEPNRDATQLALGGSASSITPSSDLLPPAMTPKPVSDSLQHSLEALFGLDPASGELPPRRLRPVDPETDLAEDGEAVERADSTAETLGKPSNEFRRDRPAVPSMVAPIRPPAAERTASNPQLPEPTSVAADTGAERRRAVARRVACRAVPVRRKPKRGLVADVIKVREPEEAPMKASHLHVRPRLVPPPAAAAARQPSERAHPERRPALAGEPLSRRFEGIGRFAARAAGVVLLIGVMIASGFGAAAFLKSPNGEVRTESAPAKTHSGGKGEFGAVQGLAANAPPRDAFAPRDRPVEVKVLQTRPLF